MTGLALAGDPSPLGFVCPPDLTIRVDAAVEIAAAAAASVDREGRFPSEAIAAFRANGLFGLLVPTWLGGLGADLATATDVCYRLGQACGSSALIFAMHSIKVACLVRHGGAWHEAFLQRLCNEQLLLASSTTEGQAGGNVRSSDAPLVVDGDHVVLSRAATVMSYGAQADAIVTTARAHPEAAAGDQKLVVFLAADYTLKPRGSWDTLGMRGTSSAGFDLEARGRAEQVLPARYDVIHAATMTPVAHLLWSSVWTGIAASAVTRAQDFVRAAMRKNGGQMPPGALYATRAAATLAQMRACVTDGVRRFSRVAGDYSAVAAFDVQSDMTLLKVEVSDLGVMTALSALRACGLTGYRNDGAFSIGRHLRDLLSAPLMINNERITGNIAAATLMAGVSDSLWT
jgi:acyl-CoA dehydrogenase